MVDGRWSMPNNVISVRSPAEHYSLQARKALSSAHVLADGHTTTTTTTTMCGVVAAAAWVRPCRVGSVSAERDWHLLPACTGSSTIGSVSTGSCTCPQTPHHRLSTLISITRHGAWGVGVVLRTAPASHAVRSTSSASNARGSCSLYVSSEPGLRLSGELNYGRCGADGLSGA